MENEQITWLKNMLSGPFDEPPVTAQIMEKPIRKVKERFSVVTNMLKQITPPDKPGIYLLVAENKRKPSFWYELPNQKIVTIGRSNSADLVINQPEVSRRHCLIKKYESGLKIIDLNSRNGIIVNNKKVSEKFLCNGDLIDLGKVYLIYINDTDCWPTP